MKEEEMGRQHRWNQNVFAVLFPPIGSCLCLLCRLISLTFWWVVYSFISTRFARLLAGTHSFFLLTQRFFFPSPLPTSPSSCLPLSLHLFPLHLPFLLFLLLLSFLPPFLFLFSQLPVSVCSTRRKALSVSIVLLSLPPSLPPSLPWHLLIQNHPPPPPSLLPSLPPFLPTFSSSGVRSF